jgi:hypothetical protein
VTLVIRIEPTPSACKVLPQFLCACQLLGHRSTSSAGSDNSLMGRDMTKQVASSHKSCFESPLVCCSASRSLVNHHSNFNATTVLVTPAHFSRCRVQNVNCKTLFSALHSHWERVDGCEQLSLPGTWKVQLCRTLWEDESI